MKELGTVLASSTTLSDLVVRGNLATVRVTDHCTVMRRMPGHAKQTMVSTEVMKDTWVRLPSGWKMKELRVLKLYRIVNGHHI
jgi:hypothetical protein